MANRNAGRITLEAFRAAPATAQEDRAALEIIAAKVGALRRHGDALLGPDLGEAGLDVLLGAYRADGAAAVPIAALARESRHPVMVTRRTIAMLADAGRLILTPRGPGRDEQLATLGPPTIAALETWLEDVGEAFGRPPGQA